MMWKLIKYTFAYSVLISISTIIFVMAIPYYIYCLIEHKKPGNLYPYMPAFNPKGWGR